MLAVFSNKPALTILNTTFALRSNYSRAAQLLSDLSFLPLESFRLQRCTEAVPSLHRALLQRLPSLLLLAAHILATNAQVRPPLIVCQGFFDLPLSHIPADQLATCKIVLQWLLLVCLPIPTSFQMEH